ncbi:MAG: hypothetical protein K2X03_12475 [Bryobacteraceae bacterium]|nr:hypothetical protein [Bryobacteraceae bacterium]
MQPTYDDANLILRLYEMRREATMRDARTWFTSSCKPQNLEDLLKNVAPPGTLHNAYYRQVTSYWEMVAGFITSGVLNKELFFQSGMELLLVWVRVHKLVPEARASFGNPKMWRNLEAVATDFIQYLGQDAYDAFAKRIG